MNPVKTLCLLGMMFSSFTQAAKVTMVVEDYPPYIRQDSPEQGFMSEMISQAFARVNVTTDIEFASWYQAEDAVDKHKKFSFMWLPSKALAKKWHFSDPIYGQKLSFVVKAGFSGDISHLHDLRKYKVGLLDGMDHGKSLDQAKAKLKITSYSSDFALLGGLLNGEVDVIAMDPVITNYLMQSYYNKAQKAQVKFVRSEHFETLAYYLVCSKNYGNCLSYIKKFNQGLAMLDADGTKAALINQAERTKE